MSEHTPPSAVPHEEIIVQLEEHNRSLQQQIDALQQQVAAQEVQIQTQEQIAAQQAAIIQQLHASLTQEKPLLDPSLPDQQREVLQAILDLPDEDNSFVEAEKLIGTLEGQPMTENFCESFKKVLFTRGWGAVCTTCLKPSGILWKSNKRYLNGGGGQFSHSAPSPHGGFTKIIKFQFDKKSYRKKHP